MTNGKKPNKKQKIFKVKLNTSWKNIFLYGFLVLIAGFLFLSATAPLEQVNTVPLSQVISDVKAGKVKEISIVDNKLTIKEQNKTVQAFKETGANTYQLFKDAGVSLDKTKVLVKDETGLNSWVNILSSVLPIVLMVAFFYFIFRQARGAQENIFSFGQSRAKLFSKDTPRIRFADVAGVDEAKQELTEIVDFLKNPGKYKAMGARTPKGVLMVGPSGTGKCVTGDTMVWTNKGLMEVREIPRYYYVDPRSSQVYGAGLASFDVEKTVSKDRMASHWFDLGEQKTIKIKLAQGYSLEGTPEHPVAVMTNDGILKFRKLADVKNGDYVAIQFGREMFGNLDLVDKDTAYLMGLLTGDGNLSHSSRIGLTNIDQEIINFFKEYTNKRYPQNKITEHEQSYLVASWDFKRYLYQMGMSYLLSFDKVVPSTILQAPREIQIAFLQGLFDTDAYVEKKRGAFEYTTVSQRLAKQIQMMLLNLGIIISLNIKGKKKNGYYRSVHRLYAGGSSFVNFGKTIGFRLTRKQKLVEKHLAKMKRVNTNIDVIPFVGNMIEQSWRILSGKKLSNEKLSKTIDKVRRRSRISRQTLQDYISYASSLPEDVPHLEYFRSLLEAKLFFSQVVEKSDGSQGVYDFTVPKTHSFLGNGFINHNTLLARATAGEANVPFFSMAGSEFMEMLVGVGASVASETPILIKQNGTTKLVSIGDFVDQHYKGEEEGLRLVKDVYTLGFDSKRGEKPGFYGYKNSKMQTITNSSFKRVSSVFRHKVKEIYEIHYLGGVIKATADHSVFVRRHGRIVPVATKDIKKGDILVELPLNIRLPYLDDVKQRHKIIAHSFLDIKPLMLDVWGDDQKLLENYEFVLSQKGLMSQYAVASSIGVSQMTVSNWQNQVHMPQLLSKKLVKMDLPDSVAVTPELLKLFGYYTAEGRGTTNLEFTFGAHETDLHNNVAGLMQEVFGIDPIFKKTKDNSLKIIYYSAHLGRFFARYCGNGSHSKHIPEFIWDFPKEYFLAFLEGYWRGDGYLTKSGKLSMSSVSKQLILELSWLCSMHGIKVGIKHGKLKGGRIIKGKPLPDCEYWNLILGKTSNPFSQEQSESQFQFKRAIVKRIIKKPYDGFVYDLCGVDNEAFFGGEKPVLLHNSRVRDLFNTAKKSQPAIIFIDEVDAIGRQRGGGLMGGHDEREQTLNQILVEMDGFAPTEQLVVIAASVTGDTPVMIKENEEVKIIPIGEFVDAYYKDNKKDEGEKAVTGIKTLGFEGEDIGKNLQFRRPAFKQLKSVFRHKVDKIYEIKYLGGTIRTTGNHSIFVRENGTIIAKPVFQLKRGEILIDLPYRLIYQDLRSKSKTFPYPENISFHKENFQVKLPVYVTSDLQRQLITNYSYAIEQSTNLSQLNIAQLIAVSQTTVGHWQKQDRLPRSVSRAYFKHTLPEEVLVTPELACLMGYFVAEGYARKEVDFCINIDEKEILADIVKLMELTFKLKPQRIRQTGKAVNITYQSKPLADFFIRHCGKGASLKHVPEFLFEAPKEYFLEFLRGVFEGDGYLDKLGRGEITSVSRRLILELNWLCRMHGIKTYMRSFTAKEGRIINGGKPLRATVAYRLGWGKNANSFIASSKNFAKLPKILSIKKLPFNGYVYDLCGCENEAFFGGESPILLHNTNRPDVLDPALIRPGRFDRRVVLDMPDVVGRKAILSIHARGKPFEKNVNWERVAKRTVGFSGADIENMLNEAAILAARLEKKAIDMKDLEEAATKVKLGPEKKRLQTDEDRKMTAYHEAGHALVSWEMPHMDPIHRISIVSRGLSLGHTMMEPTEHIHETKTRLIEQISVMLGGRAAESLVFSEMTTGASDDIAKATEVARTMVVEFGMSELGPINLDGEKRRYFEQSTVSQEMAAKIDDQVKIITDAAYKRAASILLKLRKKLDLLASELLKKETIESEEFQRLIGPKPALMPAKA